jgi:hypothetical protein
VRARWGPWGSRKGSGRFEGRGEHGHGHNNDAEAPEDNCPWRGGSARRDFTLASNRAQPRIEKGQIRGGEGWLP